MVSTARKAKREMLGLLDLPVQLVLLEQKATKVRRAIRERQEPVSKLVALLPLMPTFQQR
jgi:hypothetical protein